MIFIRAIPFFKASKYYKNKLKNNQTQTNYKIQKTPVKFISKCLLNLTGVKINLNQYYFISFKTLLAS